MFVFFPLQTSLVITLQKSFVRWIPILKGNDTSFRFFKPTIVEEFHVTKLLRKSPESKKIFCPLFCYLVNLYFSFSQNLSVMIIFSKILTRDIYPIALQISISSPKLEKKKKNASQGRTVFLASPSWHHHIFFSITIFNVGDGYFWCQT